MCYVKPPGDHSLLYGEKGTNQVCRTCMHYKSKLAWVLVRRSNGGVSVIGQPSWHITLANICGSYRFLQFVTGYGVAIACYNISLQSLDVRQSPAYGLGILSSYRSWSFPRLDPYLASLFRCIFHKHVSNCMSTHIDV